MVYEYVGPGPASNTRTYNITLKLFRDENCSNCAGMPNEVWIGIFNNDNNIEFPGTNSHYDVIKSSEGPVHVDPFPQCISNPPTLDYHVAIYTFTVTLPNNSSGYTATYQTLASGFTLQHV